MSDPTPLGHDEKGGPVEAAGQRVLGMEDMSTTKVAEAYRAAMTEHKMGFWKAVRIYKKGMFWSAVMAVVRIAVLTDHRADVLQCIIMESYDTILVGSFYALPAFQQQFGIQLANGTYQLTAPIQTAFSKPSR